MSSARRTTGRGFAGFTLMELVLVVAVLAITAMIVVSQFGNVQMQTQRATEATSQAELFRNFEMFQTKAGGSYPDQLDSLLNDTGAGFYANLSNALVSGNKKKLVVGTVNDTATEKYFTSLKSSGVQNVMWHATTVTDPSASGTVRRTLVNGDNVALLDATTTEGARIVASLYPAGLPTSVGVKLAVFGIGPANTMIGTTINAAPLDPDQDTELKAYRRYLVVMALYSDGSRARLKAVLDRRGTMLADNISDFESANRPQ